MKRGVKMFGFIKIVLEASLSLFPWTVLLPLRLWCFHSPHWLPAAGINSFLSPTASQLWRFHQSPGSCPAWISTLQSSFQCGSWKQGGGGRGLCKVSILFWSLYKEGFFSFLLITESQYVRNYDSVDLFLISNGKMPFPLFLYSGPLHIKCTFAFKNICVNYSFPSCHQTHIIYMVRHSVLSTDRQTDVRNNWFSLCFSRNMLSLLCIRLLMLS